MTKHEYVIAMARAHAFYGRACDSLIAESPASIGDRFSEAQQRAAYRYASLAYRICCVSDADLCNENWAQRNARRSLTMRALALLEALKEEEEEERL
jgi:hypothetical protein